ncbi:MAG: hypothetical protein HKN12_03470, partial [Gemmatimonadetes bacterium]|nr:hypothetical protein [Gemmatimonadota bacterium]
RVMAEFGHHVCAVDLTPVGSPAKGRGQSVVGDGFVMLRHPDLDAVLGMADRIGTDVRILAG